VMTKKVSQEQFDRASRIFEEIAVLQQQIMSAESLGHKLALRREIIALISERRKLLGLDDN